MSSTGDTLNVNGGSINGNITGPAAGGVISFTLGAGNIFTYNSNFTSFTAVDINSGTVVLNGTDSATFMTVFSGGILAGTGTLDPNLQIFSGGTLAPGPVGGIGTLTITGNLQFFAGSTYQVTISPTQASKAQVNGTATLGGATVLVAPLVGTYAPHTYTILTDTGGTLGVGGNSFAGSVTVTHGQLLDPVLTYINGGDDVDLTIQGYLVTLNVPANAPTNVQNVANVIDQYVLNGGTPPPGFQNMLILRRRRSRLRLRNWPASRRPARRPAPSS